MCEMSRQCCPLVAQFTVVVRVQVVTTRALLEMWAAGFTAIIRRVAQAIQTCKLDTLTFLVDYRLTCFSGECTGYKRHHLAIPRDSLPHGIHMINFEVYGRRFVFHVFTILRDRPTAYYPAAAQTCCSRT